MTTTIPKKLLPPPPRTGLDLPIIPNTQSDWRRRKLLDATLCVNSWWFLEKSADLISFRWPVILKKKKKLPTWAICTCDCKVNFGFYCWDSISFFPFLPLLVLKGCINWNHRSVCNGLIPKPEDPDIWWYIPICFLFLCLHSLKKETNKAPRQK